MWDPVGVRSLGDTQGEVWCRGMVRGKAGPGDRKVGIINAKQGN